MRKYTKIVAIDPGVSGGIVIYSITGKYVRAGAMPIRTEVKIKKGKKKNINTIDIAEIAGLLNEHKVDHDLLVIVEKLNMRPQDQDDPGKIFRIQKMMSDYNSLLTVLTLSRVDYIEVVPRTWQKLLKLSKDKKANKEYAARNYPMIDKITLKTSDAICILDFCRRKLKQDPKWVESRLNNH